MGALRHARSASKSCRQLVDYAHQFHGTTDATLTHGEGWSFLQVGKYLERTDSASRMLDLNYHILLPHGSMRVARPRRRRPGAGPRRRLSRQR